MNLTVDALPGGGVRLRWDSHPCRAYRVEWSESLASWLTLVSGLHPAGPVRAAGNYDAHIYSAHVAVTPFRRLYLSATCSHTDSRITTFAQNSSAIVPYRGGSYAVLGSATFAWTEKTDLVARYTFSTADYEQDFATTGLPLGLRYRQHALLAGVKHRLTTNLTTLLQYGFFDYAEPSTNHSNDYTAHAVFGSVAWQFR
jgi:hypothetical protein